MIHRKRVQVQTRPWQSTGTAQASSHYSCSEPTACEQRCLVASAVHSTANAHDSLGNLLLEQEIPTSLAFFQDKQLSGESDVGSLLEAINSGLMFLRKACLF